MQSDAGNENGRQSPIRCTTPDHTLNLPPADPNFGKAPLEDYKGNGPNWEQIERQGGRGRGNCRGGPRGFRGGERRRHYEDDRDRRRHHEDDRDRRRHYEDDRNRRRHHEDDRDRRRHHEDDRGDRDRRRHHEDDHAHEKRRKLS
ncbi:hypothetical protein L596_028866 [Steinernema carpocapsae]|uniref:Uncharacterized protein n=1 Tax=Steinernema carpocapsae TaxID=34508 RepID=A0A4U5LZN1_STECR|nr:hypothetical protein L596_028866 [Steinernema carpocapsae]